MKTKIFTLIFSLILNVLCMELRAQCCPYINFVKIEPLNPIEGQEIKVITQITTPNIGKEISTSFYWKNDTVYISGCWFSGFLTSPKSFSDTFNIGKLSVGNFVIHFKAYEHTLLDSCGADKFQRKVMNFSVNSLGLKSNIDNNYKLYPNPFKNEIVLSTTKIDNIKIYDLSGRILENIPVQGDDTTVLNLDKLKVGIYFIQLSKGNAIVYREKLIKNRN